MKKSATEAHRMLSNTYGEAAISERTCREWFQRFKNGDFEVEDQHGGGREKVFEDAELEALLDQDSCQTQQELAGSLGVTQQAISKLLKVMGMIQKQGNWGQRQKGFLHRIATGDENWIRYDNPKRRKSWGYPGHASTSTAKSNIHGSKVLLSIWWLGVVCYELLKPTETITGDRYRTQLMRLSRALKDKRPQYNKRHDKVILLHDNARPHVAKVVKTYLETLKWEVLPHPLYSPDLAPSDYHLFRSMAHGLADQHFRSYEEVKNWIDSWIASKDNQFFQRVIRTLPERWEKVVGSDGQYFEL
ncbi:mariner Mos1 transposase [Trichonephila clavipes]|nr:mariner Mos1 transposase [Trichonephila clavipes]